MNKAEIKETVMRVIEKHFKACMEELEENGIDSDFVSIRINYEDPVNDIRISGGC